MIKEGDLVKVISPTKYFGEDKELIPIGTICRVGGLMTSFLTGETSLGLIPLNSITFVGNTGI